MATSSTVRYLSPGNARGPSTLHSGKGPASNAAGVFLDIPDNSSDGNVLSANGWCKLGYVGTTASRITATYAGERYIDTTLGKTIFWDGVVWRDPSSGASV